LVAVLAMGAFAVLVALAGALLAAGLAADFAGADGAGADFAAGL
jgi:hypothetical protein